MRCQAVGWRPAWRRPCWPCRAAGARRAALQRRRPQRAWPTSPNPTCRRMAHTLVYSVTTANTLEDTTQTDLWRVGYDGSGAHAAHEHARAQRITAAVVAGRQRRSRSCRMHRRRGKPEAGKEAAADDDEEEEEISQVWLMPAGGGAARRMTTFASGVDDYVWSPDGKRLAVIVRDPERAAGAAEAEEPAADRDHALPVQGRRHRLSRRPSHASVRASTSPAAGRADHRRATTTNCCRRGRRTAS